MASTGNPTQRRLWWNSGREGADEHAPHPSLDGGRGTACWLFALDGRQDRASPFASLAGASGFLNSRNAIVNARVSSKSRFSLITM